MRNRAFGVGALLFLANIILDVWAFSNGALVLSILLATGTVLVFAAGIIWLIYHDDRRVHFQKGWLILPLAVFGAGIMKVMEKGDVVLLPSPENLDEVGGLIMTKYQIGLWLVSILLLASFVLGASMMKSLGRGGKT